VSAPGAILARLPVRPGSPYLWSLTALMILVGCSGQGASASPPSSPIPAPSPVTARFHVVISNLKFGEAVTADATSTSAGTGTLRSVLVVDDSDPGPNNDCNTVDETGTFTFPIGTVSYRSWHRDCNFTGPRIETIFAVTGGTGAWAGATGWGTERDDAPDGFAYDGTITAFPDGAGPGASE